ncbi:DUF1365 domain-containing protein [soil metagenome]
MWLCIDVDELPLLDRDLKFFGHNRRAPVSIHDTDYGGPGAGSIREKITSLLSRNGVPESIGRIDLITLPRVFGYAFNPVSFFRCYRTDGVLVSLVSEVRNTFGEAHHYILRPDNVDVNVGESNRFHCPKTFYVSPLLQVRGEYEVFLTELADSVSFEINLFQEQQLVLYADMRGRGVPLTTQNLGASAVRLPWLVATVMLRISWQAAQLYLRKKLPVYIKPEPTNPATYQPGASSVWYRLREYVIRLVATQPDRTRSTAAVLATQEETF